MKPAKKMTKVMAIVGIAFSALCFLSISLFINTDSAAAAGWGVYASLYLLALSIVAVVQALEA